MAAAESHATEGAHDQGYVLKSCSASREPHDGGAEKKHVTKAINNAMTGSMERSFTCTSVLFGHTSPTTAVSPMSDRSGGGEGGSLDLPRTHGWGSRRGIARRVARWRPRSGVESTSTPLRDLSPYRRTKDDHGGVGRLADLLPRLSCPNKAECGAAPGGPGRPVAEVSTDL